ncbi:sodium:solute symporter [Desulfosporosinus sp. SB140]|uniref:sodium:solute symporter family protein n=1 Tax=Desulfosporosinus paludis TaxID=3115649 RepID=UPI00388DB839
MTFTPGFIIGIAITLIAFTIVGLYAARLVKSEEDFSVAGRRASSATVAGILMGTFFGGGSTFGTAQLAFTNGLDALWFTLGGGIGVVILALTMSRRLRESAVATIPQFLVGTYGDTIGPIASIFSSIGTFLAIVAQGLTIVALLGSLFGMSPIPALLVGIVFVLIYVFYGGVWGAGLIGVLKIVLVFLAVVISGAMAYHMVGGLSGLTAKFPPFPWFSLFGRGFKVDFGNLFSLVVGVITTQTYVQAILSGKTVKESRNGALISGILIALGGFGGVLVGMFMRANFPHTPSDQVLPIFIMKFFPPLVAGIFIAVFFVTILVTWSGLTLGVATMLAKDIYKKLVRPQAQDREMILVQRLLVFVVSSLCIFFVSGNLKSMILSWSFFSMGLRGCTAMVPMIGALFFRRWVTPWAGIMAAVLGPVADLAWHILYPKGLDPLYVGLLASLLAMVVISLFKKRSIGNTPDLSDIQM